MTKKTRITQHAKSFQYSYGKPVNDSLYPGCKRALLNLCILMDSSFWFDTINLGKSIVHIYVRLKFSKNIVFFSLKIFFTFTNSVDPDEMSHYAAFHLGLH